MKNIVITLLAVATLIVLNCNAHAAPKSEESNATAIKEGAKVLVVELAPSTRIGGKYFISNDAAITGGIGLDSASSKGESATKLDITGGYQKFLSVSQLSSSIGFQLGYSSDSGAKSNKVSAGVLFAADYFFSKRFSVEGFAGFGVLVESQSGSSSITHIGTINPGVMLNYFF